MLKLDNKPLSYDRAFTHDGIQYPANWLRLSSLEERNALGIVEVADAPSYDQRFYWGVGNPKDLDELKTNWSNQQNITAGTLLHDSDWRVVKASETNTEVPAEWTAYRSAVRTACNARQAEIEATTTVEELKELLYGPAFINQTNIF